MSQKQLAQALGLSDRTVRTWADCPRNEDKSYSLPKVVQWLISEAEDASFGSTSETEEGNGSWLSLFRRERFFLAKLEREKAEGELIPRSEVATLWAVRVGEVTSGLQGLVDRLPPLLVGKDRVQIREIVHEEIWRLRDQYARGGRHCETPETSTNGR